jgi:hypothetical protein
MISGEKKPNNLIYGYIKDETGELAIDRTAAPVLREMYQLAAQGVSVNEIRDKFTEAAYPTPSEHIKLGVHGKMILPWYGKENFLAYGKQFFPTYGKENFPGNGKQFFPAYGKENFPHTRMQAMSKT